MPTVGVGTGPRCEKCGSADIFTRYRAEGERLDDAVGMFGRAPAECLRRLCRTCGFRWNDPVVAHS